MEDSLVSQLPEGLLVIDSRVVASQLDLDHSDWMQNIIKKYQPQAEQAFGSLRFENDVKKRDVGATTQKFAWLTEDQALFYTTLSKNTDKVVQTKIKIISEFSKTRKLLLGKGYQEVTTSVYIRRLERIRDHEIGYDLWSVFKESAEILLLVEKDFKIPVQTMDLCDGSIGDHWRKYREGKEWADKEDYKYIHKFPDYRPDVFPYAYKYSELPYFRRWLKEVYEPDVLPEYLVRKYGKRAVIQIYQEQNKLNDYILELTQEKRKAPKEEEKYNAFLAMRQTIIDRENLLKGN